METTWTGRFALPGCPVSTPSASAIGARSRKTAPKAGFPWVMITRPGFPPDTSISRGNVPTPTCWKIRVTGSWSGNRPARAMT